MTKEEFVKSIEYNGIKIDIGEDDYGQQYFLEYTDRNGKIHEIGCGAYNTNYMDIIEAELGVPKLNCEYYEKETICSQYAYGFCYKCPKNELVIAREERLKRQGYMQ